MFQERICVRWCFWSRLCACVCNDTREFSCVALYMLVYGWRALTEGHGSCTLSVWTLAEPLGVLFQARSDNLAPMTRLATAQFTGRSSTHAQPPPPPTPTSFSPSPHSLSVPPCTLLHLSTLPSLSSQLFSISPFMLCFFFFSFHNPSCFPFSLYFYDTVVNKTETACWHLGETGPADLPMETDKLSLTLEHPDQACGTSSFVDEMAEVAVFTTTTLIPIWSWDFKEYKTPLITAAFLCALIEFEYIHSSTKLKHNYKGTCTLPECFYLMLLNTSEYCSS